VDSSGECAGVPVRVRVRLRLCTDELSAGEASGGKSRSALVGESAAIIKVWAEGEPVGEACAILLGRRNRELDPGAGSEPGPMDRASIGTDKDT